MSACRVCGAAIFFLPTMDHAMMPIDQEPNPEGNIIIENNLLGASFARVLSKAESDVPGTRYMPHFATCEAWER